MLSVQFQPGQLKIRKIYTILKELNYALRSTEIKRERKKEEKSEEKTES